jgi:hypothetical protein
VQIVEVAQAQGGAAEDGMDVRVLETREQELAGQVDDLGAGSDQVLHVGVAADRGDPAAGDSDGGGPGACRVDREARAAGEDEVCERRSGHRSSRGEFATVIQKSVPVSRTAVLATWLGLEPIRVTVLGTAGCVTEFEHTIALFCLPPPDRSTPPALLKCGDKMTVLRTMWGSAPSPHRWRTYIWDRDSHYRSTGAPASRTPGPR